MLRDEYRWFEANRNSLLVDYYGRYIVIKGKAVIADYAGLEEAYSDTIKNEALGTFIIQQCIKHEEEEIMHYVNVDIDDSLAVGI